MSFFTLSDSPAVTFYPLSTQLIPSEASTFAQWILALDAIQASPIGDFKEALDDLLPNWRATGSALAQPISAVNQAFHWPLVSFSEGDDISVAASTALSWRLNGEAALQVEKAPLPEKIASVVDNDSSRTCLRYAFTAEGSVTAGAQAELQSMMSFNLAAAVAASAKAAASQEVVAYTQHAPDTIVYEALLRDGAQLSNLLSLDGFRDNVLSAVVIKRQGELSFSSAMGVRVGLASSNKTNTLINLELPKASFDMEHAWSMQGAFDVLMYRPAGFDGVRLRVSKASNETSSTNWSFNAGVKFTGLTQRVSEALSKLGSYPLAINEWLQKTTVLSNQLDDLLAEHIQDLPEEIQGLLPSITGADALDKQWVMQELKQALEAPYSQITQWNKDASAYQSMLNGVAQQLFGSESVAVTKWIDKLFGDIQTNVLGNAQKWLDDLVAEQGEAIAEHLLEPLSEVDDRFEMLFDEVDTATEAFRQPFMNLLDEFQQGLQSLTSTVQQTMTDELQLVYSLNESKLRTHDAVIEVSFPFYDVATEQGQQASALLAACLSGNFQPLLACHHSGDESLKSLFNLENSVFSSVFIARQDSQLMLNVFGWKIGRRRAFEQITKLQYSGDGVMSVAQTQANTEFQSGSFCLRVNSFANLMATRDSNLVVSLRYDDDLLEKQELNRLLSQLESQKLISAARSSAIRQVLIDEMYLDQEKQCALQINLSVMPSHLEKALGSDKVQQQAQDIALYALSAAWERYMLEHQQLRYKRTIAVIKSVKPSHSLAKNILALGAMSSSAKRKKLSKAAERLGISFGHQGSILSKVNPAAKFVDYAFAMSQDFVKLIEAFKQVNGANANVSDSGAEQLDQTQVSDLLASVGAKFEECFEDWVEGFGYLPGIDTQQIHPGQLALFIALMKLTEVPESALNVKLVLKESGKSAKYVNC